MVALASGATPVPRLDVLTTCDVGRGPKAKHRGKEYEDAPNQDSHRCTGSSAAERRAGEDVSQEGVFPSSCSSCGRQGSEIDEPDTARFLDSWPGMAVSLLEVGTTSDDQNKFVPTPATRVGPGLSTPDIAILLHQPKATADAYNDYERRGAQQPASRSEYQAGGHATVGVVLCGPIPSACEELRHRCVRIAAFRGQVYM